MNRELTAACMAAMFAFAAPLGASEFEPPVQLLADGKPIDVRQTGHSAPFVGDFDGDGLPDLLVGEFHEGRLRIFRNVGSPEEPKFGGYQWFKAGADLGRVPTG